MEEKKIEEMVEFLNNRINVERNSYFGKGCITIPLIEAEKILDILKGYRKQSEGENISQMHPSDEFICEMCGLIIRECCRKVLLELQKFSIDTSNQYGVGYSDCLTAVEDLLNDLQESSTSDVVEVVRCKDCQRSRPMIFDGFYYCKRVRAVRKADDFCSKDKRKGGEG